MACTLHVFTALTQIAGGFRQHRESGERPTHRFLGALEQIRAGRERRLPTRQLIQRNYLFL